MPRVYSEKEFHAQFVEVRPGVYKAREGKTTPTPLKKKEVPKQFAKIKAGSYSVGGKIYKFRSSYEYIYASYLDLLKKAGEIKDWEYESEACHFVFDQIKHGTTQYLVDFRIIENDGTHRFVETKGFLDKKSVTKIKRFRKYYPNERLDLIRGAEIAILKKQLGIKDL